MGRASLALSPRALCVHCSFSETTLSGVGDEQQREGDETCLP